MNKNERIILYLIAILACLIITVLIINKTKDTSYYCQITGRNTGGYESWKVIEDYDIQDNMIELYQKNGVVLEYDLEEIIVICTEMEEIK